MRVLDEGMKVDRLTHYRSAEGSHYHFDKYKRWNKVLVHRVECAILHRLLARTGRSHEILDAPCGPGRFVNVITQYADQVCLGDISPYMLDIAREQSQDRVADYRCIDLRNLGAGNSTFEGVVSIRLTHHFYAVNVLEEYLQNLARLARRWVIVTFRDARTPRTIWRRGVRRMRGKDQLPAQTIDEISTAMCAHGFYLVATAQVSRWFSGHRYALYVRNLDSL
jgi:SAM-dependent methyltransferase